MAIKDFISDKTKVEKTIRKVKEDSELIQSLSDKIYREYSEELDNLVLKTKNLLTKIKNGELKNYSDEYLELQCLSLPTLLYDAIDALEDLGSKQDLSKIYYDEIYSQVYSSITEGTIPDKEAEAKRQSISEKMASEIYKRAYNKLKKKFDVALELHSSIKKVLDKRIKNLEVFRRDNTPGNMKDELDKHEGR